MRSLGRLCCLLLVLGLSACAGSPPIRYFSLDDGRPRAAKSFPAPSIAVVRANVPDLIDRPHLVFRNDGNQVTIDDQARWAEPLRRQIPRVIANDLGELLDSSRVAALPSDAGGFDVDFKIVMNVQQLDAVAGRGADVDVLWRVEPRGGRSLIGRSSFRQPTAGGATDHASLVAAQRQGLRRVAAEIAKEIAAYPKP